MRVVLYSHKVPLMAAGRVFRLNTASPSEFTARETIPMQSTFMKKPVSTCVCVCVCVCACVCVCVCVCVAD